MKSIMRNKTRIMIGIIAVVVLLILVNIPKDTCGDGICRRLEDRRGICPEDCGQENADVPEDRLVKGLKIFQDRAAHSDWSPDANQIAFERIGKDLYFQLYIGDSDGTNIRSLTEDNPSIHQLNNGWPAWQPSGGYIVFQSEEPEHYNMGDRWLPFSGNGFYNNLWAGRTDGSEFWKLTDIEIKKRLLDGIAAKAVVSPHFSHDGLDGT